MNTNTQPLITRHRPKTFEEVWGNKEKVAALQRRISEPGRPHAYLFSGPSGTGKTTLARIVGAQIDADILEVDAATNNGVDAMRTLMDLGYYMAPNSQARMLILDEAHMLSRASFNAILKTLEEPPPHLYLALCTTEHFRIPETVVNRCHPIELRSLSDEELEEFLDDVTIKEGWDTRLQADIFHMIVAESNGSPRKCLSLLQLCYDAPTLVEAQRIASLQGSQEPIDQIMRMLVSGQGGWEPVQRMLVQLTDDDFTEGTLVRCCRYLVGAMKRPDTTEAQARRYWDMLSFFIYPTRSYDYQSVFYHAVGRILWEMRHDSSRQ